MRALSQMTRRDFCVSTLAASAGALLCPTLALADSSPPNPHKTSTEPTHSVKDSGNDISVQWIGHSTMLITIAGKRILTDPVLSDTIGMSVLGIPLGITRYTPPAVTLDDLPKPDLILLSHAHIDHTDLPTLRHLSKRFPDQIPIITAKNTADVIDGLAWKNVHELDWNQDITIEGLDGLTVCGLETLHNGCRMPWERDRRHGYVKTGRSYNAYLIRANGKTLVFGGDTDYTPAFTQLASESVDIAMMPIGAYGGCEGYHCTPEAALRMADDMQAKSFIPMHCNTFAQLTERSREPLERLVAAAPRHQTQVVMKRIGQTVTLPQKKTLAGF